VIPYAYITGYNWEAYTPTTITAVPGDEGAEEDVTPGTQRTITLKVKGNVNIVLE
jgi:hypothetical protein